MILLQFLRNIKFNNNESLLRQHKYIKLIPHKKIFSRSTLFHHRSQIMKISILSLGPMYSRHLNRHYMRRALINLKDKTQTCNNCYNIKTHNRSTLMNQNKDN